MVWGKLCNKGFWLIRNNSPNQDDRRIVPGVLESKKKCNAGSQIWSSMPRASNAHSISSAGGLALSEIRNKWITTVLNGKNGLCATLSVHRSCQTYLAGSSEKNTLKVSTEISHYMVYLYYEHIVRIMDKWYGKYVML